MKEHLLKRALPFMLTFAIGAGVGGFFQFFTSRAAGWLAAKRNTYSYASRRGCGKRFRRAYAPESKPPVITFKPDAVLSQQLATIRPLGGFNPVPVRVTFGADGLVREAEALGGWSAELRERAEYAARNIKFIPATVEGAPTTVTEVVEIRISVE